MSTLTELAALWGAAVSTGLALLRVAEFRYMALRQLTVTALARHECQDLCVVVENGGKRPVTLSALEVRYGPDAQRSALVLRITENLPARLGEGDPLEWTIGRSVIVDAARSQNVVQVAQARLWLAIHSPGRPPRYRFITFDRAFIPFPSVYNYTLHDYLASDSFLGFPESEYRPSWGRSNR